MPLTIENEDHDPEGVLTDEEYHALRFSQADVDAQVRTLLEEVNPLAWKSLVLDAVSIVTSANLARISSLRRHGGDHRSVQVSAYRVAEFIAAIDKLDAKLLDRGIEHAKNRRREITQRREDWRSR